MREKLTRAEGFFELGMHQEAWNETEELPPIDRTEPLVLELRLRTLTALEKFELGGHIAGVLEASAIEPEKCRETCARFYHAHSRRLCADGELEAARKAMRMASEIWPEIRIEIVDDKKLQAALRGDDSPERGTPNE